MKTREEILADNPLERVFQESGALLKKVPGEGSFITNRCAMREHKPGHLCVSLNGDVWHCHDCGEGGSVIDFIAKSRGVSIKEAMEALGGPREDNRPPARQQGKGPANSPAPRLVKLYDYTDEGGELLYQVCRYEPKTFRQRHRGPDGAWVYSMEGVRRVLYNLPAVLKSDCIWIVEGEKDADTLNGFGMCATCNVGGAGKWDESYTRALKDKDVVMCGDSDEAGQKHVAKVLEQLGGSVRTTRVVKVPQGYKDVTEWLEKEPDAAGLCNLAESAEVLTRGIRLPIRSMKELEAEYVRFVRNAPLTSLRISDWLPSTAGKIRPVVPGELVAIIAGTGVGKTMVLQNLALSTAISTLLFELELPGTLTFERFVAMNHGVSGRTVEQRYYEGQEMPWRETGNLDHIHVCSESKMTPKELERIIINAPLKTGMRPVLVLVDYIQLMGGQGDRRERVSDSAEELKVIAKATNTIIVITSQTARKKTDSPEEAEVFLNDGKESGSIENSAGLVLGLWKTSKERMMVKVMKNTKGTAGDIVACDIKEGLVIQEATKQEQT